MSLKIDFKLQISNFKFRRRLARAAFALVTLVVIFAIFAKLTVPPAAGAWLDDSFAYSIIASKVISLKKLNWPEAKRKLFTTKNLAKPAHAPIQRDQ